VSGRFLTEIFVSPSSGQRPEGSRAVILRDDSGCGAVVGISIALLVSAAVGREGAVRSTAEENPCQFESVHRAKRHGHDRISQPRRRERHGDRGIELG